MKITKQIGMGCLVALCFVASSLDAQTPGQDFKIMLEPAQPAEVTPASSDLTYQWYKNSSPLRGAVGSTYTIEEARIGHMGDYTVVVSNDEGSVTSSPARLTVVEGNAFWVQDVTCQYCSGEYGDYKGRHVNFLEGVPVPQFPMSSTKVEFTVEFFSKSPEKKITSMLVNGKVFGIENEKTGKLSVPVGEWPAGSQLVVCALTEDGSRSKPFRANFDIIPQPFLFTADLAKLPRTKSANLYYPGMLEVLNIFTANMPNTFEHTFPSDVPLIGGKDFSIKPILNFVSNVTGDGTHTIGINGGTGFGLGDGKSARLRMSSNFKEHYYSDQNDWRMDTIALGIGISGSYSLLAPIQLGPTPFTANASLNFGGEGTLSVANNYANTDMALKFAGNPMVEVVGMIGVGASAIANVSLYGGLGIKGDISVKKSFDSNWNDAGGGLYGNLALTGRVGWQSSVAVFRTPQYDLWKGTQWFYRNGWCWVSDAHLPTASSLPEIFAASARLDYGLYEPIPRDYLSRVHAADTTPKKVELTGGSELTLEASTFPEPDPALYKVGSDLELFHLRDQSGRSAENRTELVFRKKSAQGEETWSSPVAVWDDGTADFMPEADVLGTDQTMVVWANEASVLADGAGLEEVLAKMEIAGALRNADGSWSAQNLTQNEVLDHSPLVAAKGQEAWIAWVRNASNNVSGSAQEPNTLMALHYSNGAWGAEQVIATGIGLIGYTDLAFNGSEGIVIYSTDLDSNQETPDDQELFACTLSGTTWSQPLRLTEDTVCDVRPCVVYDSVGHLLVVWYRDGKIVSKTLESLASLELSQPSVIGDAEGEGSAQDFKFVRGDKGQMAIVWETRNHEAVGDESLAYSDPVILNYDPTFRVWSKPVRLLEDEQMENAFSGCFDTDGQLRLAYAKTAVVREEGVPMPGDTDLCVLTHPVGADLCMSATDQVFSKEDPQPGDEIEITTTIRNLGALPASGVKVSLYQHDDSLNSETLLETYLVEGTLAGGESREVTWGWTVPNNDKNGYYYLVVSSDAVDRNYSNDVLTILSVEPDLVLSSAWATVDAERKAILHVEVTNEGLAPAPAGAKLRFYKENSTGELLNEIQLPGIGIGSDALYATSWDWDMSQMTSTNAIEVVYVQLITGNGDEEHAQRETQIEIMSSLDSDGDGLLDAEETLLGTDPKQRDTDRDGLTDYEEARLYKTDPLETDTDGDGAPDYQEILARTDPLDAASHFKVEFDPQNGEVVLTFTGTLYESPDGVSDWTPVTGAVSPYTVRIGNNNKFYRTEKAVE